MRSARRDNKLEGLTKDIEGAGLSAPPPAIKPTVLGRSELLRKR